MSSSEAAVYERGDALEALHPEDSLTEATEASVPPDSMNLPSEVYDLTEDEHWQWLASLIREGSNLDEHLDDLLEDVYDLEPPFYSPTGRRRLKDLLRQLHDVRTSVRAFEQDVEQLSFVFSRSDKVETVAGDNAELVLSSVKRTYDRAYDLCLYKLDRISDGWITATNLLISLTILVVTILFWMEFR